MIPIIPFEHIEWNDVDCMWYLDEVRSFTIQHKICTKWYDELKISFSAVSTDAFCPYPSRKDGCKYFMLSDVLPLWDRCFMECGITDSFFSEKECSKCSSIMEKIIIARYETLFELHKFVHTAISEQKQKLLMVVGDQICKQYDKLSSKGVNREIVNRHRVYVCPYCGSTMIGNLRNGKFSANLDHFFPKHTGANGIFSLSLFNLVPCCPICNHTKKEQSLMVSPYDSAGRENDVVFWFAAKNGTKFLENPISSLTKGEIDLYLTSHGKVKDPPLRSPVVPGTVYALGYGNDAITLGYAEYPKVGDLNNSRVKYTWLSDVAADFLLFLFKNGMAYTEDIQGAFKKLSIQSAVTCNDYNTSAVYLKIPLSKLRHDLLQQLSNGDEYALGKMHIYSSQYNR